MIYPHRDVRFWDKVFIGNGDACWEWQGAIRTDGYGHLRRNKKDFAAHRFAYVQANGPIPGKLHVLHRCDNRKCVRPDHLFLGTIVDNANDMVLKGRMWRQVLSASDALAIRARYQKGIHGYKKVAAEFGVSVSCVRAVVNRRSWKFLEGAENV